jgi:glycerophosphoryl diester phosphodiesterase
MSIKNILILIIGVSILTFLSAMGFAMNNQLPIKNVTALSQAHSHNDYEHNIPLFDALNHGFTRIEPDVFILYKDKTGQLVDDKLKHFNDADINKKQDALNSYEIMVGHDPGEYKGTLYDLYLKPLEQLKAGQYVFEKYNFPVLYMIDMKTNYPGSVEFMNSYLSQFKNIIQCYNSTNSKKPVYIILSGYNGKDFRQKDLDYLLTAKYRYIGIDGRVDKPLLGQNRFFDIFPLISSSWNNRSDETFHKNIVEAHKNGHQIRFWGTADNKEVWEKMYRSGADVISTDNHKEVQDFLNSKSK